uniref:histidine ammonia-lyase-like n=1 Tax=Oncorhynchus gorbuscha TaxID=8017 RepID=UPI001EAF0963|nr:histidine ammonia-lyase-like [Oncorhynchus gorbuscha]
MARRFRTLLDSDHHPSEITEIHRFWSPGCLHYTPQVHDIVNNTIDFAQKSINTEINSASANPVPFAVCVSYSPTIPQTKFDNSYLQC